MSTTATPQIDFYTLNEALKRSQAMADASEAHGILCGLICATGKPSLDTWFAHILSDQDPRDALTQDTRRQLVSLNEQTIEQISEGEYQLRLMIDDDDESLELRLESLVNWCQGFLVGLSLGGITEVEKLPEEAEEITRDFLEISRVGFDPGEGTEESEAAFEEIVEYVRIGVFVVYDELNDDPPLVSVSASLH